MRSGLPPRLGRKIKENCSAASSLNLSALHGNARLSYEHVGPR